MSDNYMMAAPKKSFKRCGIKAFTEAKVTPVVLVCIYNQGNALITHDVLYNTFIHFGKILRILIFEKMKVWKAFVEFDNIDSAFEAKRDLNDFLLFDDGTRINVYYSNLETIKFQNTNAGGKDYTTDDFQSDDHNEPEQEIDSEVYGMGQDQEALTMYAGSHMSPQRFDYYENPGSIATHGYAYAQDHPTQVTKTDSNFDDKDDEILKMINDHQNGNNTTTEKPREPQSINEEEKLDGEDQDKDLFSQFFNNTFQSKPANSPFKANRSKTTAPLSLKSVAFGSQPWQQPNHGQIQRDVTPPGLTCYDNTASSMGFPARQREQPKLLGYSNSSTQIPRVSMPMSATKPASQFSSPLKPQKTGLIPSFHSMHSIPTNYGPPFHQILNNPPEDMGRVAQYPQIARTDSRTSFNQRISSQSEIPVSTNPSSNYDGMGYEDLIEMIEQDIRQNSNGNFNDGGIGGLLQQNMGNMDVSNLSNLSLSALSHLYNELSVILGKADNVKKSAVLYVKGLEDDDIQANMLYNIFSNFGNIVKIYFMKNKTSALIEFENAEHATAAKDSLHDEIFMGAPLEIYYSNGPILNTNDIDKSDPSDEIFIGSTKNGRFKKNKTVTINPPSPILHISNLTRDVCTEEIIKKSFSSYGRIEGVKFMFVENKNMCLLKMASVEQSLIAMAYLHDTDLGGRNMQVSFTRSKF